MALNYLMIDTAEGTRVLAGVNGKTKYGENLKNAGAETLMPMIDCLLKELGATVRDIDIIGASVGPGSFTGLRVGLATVKTICYALDKPCFAVNNLRLNSYNNDSAKVISVADAGSRVCYIAVFDGDREIEPTQCVTLDGAREMISRYDGYSVSTDFKLKDVLCGKAGVGERELAIAVEKHIDRAIDGKDLLPLYVRKAQPERKEGDL